MKFEKGIDIVTEVARADTTEEVRGVLAKHLDMETINRLRTHSDPNISITIANAITMCIPDTVHINTGSESDRKFIRNMALAKGEEVAPAKEGCTIHYDLKEEQHRVIDRTFYIGNHAKPSKHQEENLTMQPNDNASLSNGSRRTQTKKRSTRKRRFNNHFNCQQKNLDKRGSHF